MIALVVSVGSGVGYIEVKGFFNANINSRTEVEKYTPVPILGELVKSKDDTVIVVNEANRSFIAEGFRHLRTALSYLGINSRKKRLLITSSISAEGKSFVAVNLAISLALTNKRVVLVDLDLRRPTLARILKVEQADGISQYLNGEKEIEAIIKRTNSNQNLFLIPSGPVAFNPSELLLSDKIKELFTYLESVFDYVVIDTSPVAPVTDACILSPLCDATLYVIRQGVTPKIFVQKLDKYRRIRNLKNVAIVLNDVKGSELNKYNQYYDYSYSYMEQRKSKIKRKGTAKES